MASRPTPIRRRTDLRGNSQDLIPWVFRSILATALFRCWHLILLFTAWAACVTVITDKVRDMSIQPTLLTAFGTILGFVISYRTSSAFERYNEGRRLWSTIILASRTFARTVWFHVPDASPSTEPKCTNCAHCTHSTITQSTEHIQHGPKPEQAPTEQQSQLTAEERDRCQILIEKRTIINLIEAFSIAVKHYLRGEEGIEYEDLYHLVKFLPAYQLPGSIPNQRIVPGGEPTTGDITQGSVMDKPRRHESYGSTSTKTEDPEPQMSNTHEGIRVEVKEGKKRGHGLLQEWIARKQVKGAGGEIIELAPANNPPGWAIYDMWPLSYFTHASAGVTQSGDYIAGTKAAKIRVKQRVVTLNVPLEITFYLSSYISAVQRRKLVNDVPTINTMLLGLNQLVDSLSGLERVLTSPIPFSYGAQLWTSCFLYLAFLPFQLWQSLKYITIPATAAVSFIFFGFLAAGEEIEDPFGYDKNDLDMHHFCQNIIHEELVALTSVPVPKPDDWAFSDDNDYVFESEGEGEIKTPKDWMVGGENAMREVLKRGLGGKD